MGSWPSRRAVRTRITRLAAEALKIALIAQLDELVRRDVAELLEQRSKRYRAIGAFG